MTSVGAYEAKTHLPRLLDQVASGETVIITRHGYPVAKLVPADVVTPAPEQVIAALKEFRCGASLGKLSIKKMIAEGRK
ncbi:MAG: type II toxin-antitoxin system prevent-host-death family antitoxin [Actinobacteria bacterium]|jgi:prevent-host-death family protein|nr:type II toxin-antitoxin system prevent-host-death family antitoxin [Actinomycetota bacterium]